MSPEGAAEGREVRRPSWPGSVIKREMTRPGNTVLQESIGLLSLYVVELSC